MPHDRVRQVAPGLVRRPGGRGQRLLVGPRQPVGRQRLAVLADRCDRKPAHAATGSPPARAGLGRLGRGSASRASASRYAASASSVFPVDLEQPGDGRQAPADLDRRRRAGPRLGRQRLPRRQHRPVRRQRILVAADLAVSSASSKFDRASARREAGRSPCPAGPRACRRSRPPTSAAGPAAP